MFQCIGTVCLSLGRSSANRGSAHKVPSTEWRTNSHSPSVLTAPWMTPLFSIWLGRHTFFLLPPQVCVPRASHTEGEGKSQLNVFLWAETAMLWDHAHRQPAPFHCGSKTGTRCWHLPSQANSGKGCPVLDQKGVTCSAQRRICQSSVNMTLAALLRWLKVHAVEAPITPPYSVRCCAHQPIG